MILFPFCFVLVCLGVGVGVLGGLGGWGAANRLPCQNCRCRFFFRWGGPKFCPFPRCFLRPARAFSRCSLGAPLRRARGLAAAAAGGARWRGAARGRFALWFLLGRCVCVAVAWAFRFLALAGALRVRGRGDGRGRFVFWPLLGRCVCLGVALGVGVLFSGARLAGACAWLRRRGVALVFWRSLGRCVRVAAAPRAGVSFWRSLGGGLRVAMAPRAGDLFPGARCGRCARVAARGRFWWALLVLLRGAPVRP